MTAIAPDVDVDGLLKSLEDLGVPCVAELIVAGNVNRCDEAAEWVVTMRFCCGHVLRETLCGPHRVLLVLSGRPKMVKCVECKHWCKDVVGSSEKL